MSYSEYEEKNNKKLYFFHFFFAKTVKQDYIL